MEKFVIVTNNPMTSGKYPGSVRVEGSPLDVIRKAESLLLEGFVLWGSLLSPNGRLMQNPFRSVVLCRNEDTSCGGRDFLLAGKAVEILSDISFLSSDGDGGEDLAFMDLELLDVSLRDHGK